MLARCILAEGLKLRHSRIWGILLVLPLISVLIGCANFYMNQGVLQKEWYSLWSQTGLFYGQFFFPILMAICCAYLCRLEHFQKNWNLMLTAPVPVSSIFWAKLSVAGVLLALVQALFFALYWAGGSLVGLSGALPSELPGWLFRGWFAGLAVCSLQLMLSMRIRSFAVPIGLGLCASLLGLGLQVFKLGMLFPHSLLASGMGVLSQTGFSAGQLVPFYIMSGLYTLFFGAIAIRRLRRSDVAA